ncbi:MAG: NAD-dependent epimerase/dehydratase family protein [Bacilli bacterium]
MVKYLITGGAGFIGSRISEILIEEGNWVRVIDNLSSGDIKNLDSIINHPNFSFIEGDIRDFNACLENTKGIDYVIHQAALVSVPKSIEMPLENNSINVDGFVNILEAARINNIKRVIYASSSAVYGDNNDKLKNEDRIGNSISPYALSKYMDELYASLYNRVYNIETVGLRYFNVYGPKQDPSSVYSGVISIFMNRLLKNEDLSIYGDGSITRDFVYVDDVARANILATTTKLTTPCVYNIGTSISTSIKDLGKTLINLTNKDVKINYLPSRAGDILYSCANIDKAKKELGFNVSVKIEDGLMRIYKELSKK